MMAVCSHAQPSTLRVALEPINIPNLGGLQSFAHGQFQGEWLLVGGRLDGLHRRQPFAAFDALGNNTHLIVVNPVTQQTWSISTTSLPDTIREQLSSTNMQFYQHDTTLLLVGGYGISFATQSKITFQKLTALSLPSLIQAIKTGQSIQGFFRQIADSNFAVTGGHLKRIGDVYYLLGGNRFDGNYNPMGNPTYTQAYTNAVRKFKLVDNGQSFSINWLSPYIDATHLHRRDYNAVAQIMPNGEPGITMFSGVFQPTVNLPFLYNVEVDSQGFTPNTAFQQRYNHYHCPTIPLYDSLNNQMHTLFFGGIAQFYDSLGTLVQDNNVPFVKTIAQVTRNSNGQLIEQKLPIEMPFLQGAGAEFILNKANSKYDNGVIKFNRNTSDTLLLGYIFGGIQSNSPNIFNINTGIQSVASNVLFRVKLLPSTAVAVQEKSSIFAPNPVVFPNPSAGEFRVQFELLKSESVNISMLTADGQLLYQRAYDSLPAGLNTLDFPAISSGHSISFIQINTSAGSKTLKLIQSRRR